MFSWFRKKLPGTPCFTWWIVHKCSIFQSHIFRDYCGRNRGQLIDFAAAGKTNTEIERFKWDKDYFQVPLLLFRSLVQDGKFSNLSSNVGLIFIGAEKPTNANQWKWASTDRTGEFLEDRYEYKIFWLTCLTWLCIHFHLSFSSIQTRLNE